MTSLDPSHPLHRMTRIEPHNNAHLVALRVLISGFIPLALLVALGRYDLTTYAAFGSMASLYGRAHRYPERAGMQLWALLSLVTSVALGVVVSGVPHRQWWVVAGGAVVAGAGSWLSDSLRQHPPGPVFMLFGFAVCASTSPGISYLPIALLAATASGLFAVSVGQVGGLRNRHNLGAPIFARPRLRTVVAARDAVRHLLRYVIATTVAGTIATLIGGTHPYWAVVSCVVALGGPDLASRLVRGLQRIVGTLLGLVVAWLLLSWHPSGMGLVVVIALLQAVTELLVGRNYALACMFITPLALAMGQLVHPVTMGPLLVDRGWETVLGAITAFAALVLIPVLRLSQVRDGVELRRRTSAQSRDLGEHEPHPVTGLVPRPQFLQRAGIGAPGLLRLYESFQGHAGFLLHTLNQMLRARPQHLVPDATSPQESHHAATLRVRDPGPRPTECAHPGGCSRHLAARHRARGTPRGRLGATMGYPGMILRDDAPAVHGVVLSSPELSSHWDRLDAFEGDGYRRATASATLDDGSTIDVQVYVLADA